MFDSPKSATSQNFLHRLREQNICGFYPAKDYDAVLELGGYKHSPTRATSSDLDH
jgi:hypothetical protein